MHVNHRKSADSVKEKSGVAPLCVLSKTVGYLGLTDDFWGVEGLT